MYIYRKRERERGKADFRCGIDLFEELAEGTAKANESETG